MRFSVQHPLNIIMIWMLLMFASCFSPSSSALLSFGSRLKCGTNNETSQRFVRSVDKVMGALSKLIAAQGWGTFSDVDPPFTVFGLGQCYQHVNGKGVYQQEFQRELDQVIRKVTNTALENNGYAAKAAKGGVTTVYALAQCWRAIDLETCSECLRHAASGLRKCAPGAEGKAMFSGCYMRYSTHRFFGPEAETEDNKGFSPWVIIGLASAGVACAVLGAIGTYISYKRFSKKKGLDDIPATRNNTSLNYMYGTLEKATDHFDESRKLGQGGAGTVFKGFSLMVKLLQLKGCSSIPGSGWTSSLTKSI